MIECHWYTSNILREHRHSFRIVFIHGVLKIVTPELQTEKHKTNRIQKNDNNYDDGNNSKQFYDVKSLCFMLFIVKKNCQKRSDLCLVSISRHFEFQPYKLVFRYEWVQFNVIKDHQNRYRNINLRFAWKIS